MHAKLGRIIRAVIYGILLEAFFIGCGMLSSFFVGGGHPAGPVGLGVPLYLIAMAGNLPAIGVMQLFQGKVAEMAMFVTALVIQPLLWSLFFYVYLGFKKEVKKAPVDALRQDLNLYK